MFFSLESVVEIWGELVDGGIMVFVCFGDYYFMSDLFYVYVIGSVLVIVLLFSYCLLFLEFLRFKRIFS